MAKKTTREIKSEVSLLDQEAAPAIAFDEVMEMVRNLELTDERIEEAEKRTTELKELRRKIAEEVIPAYLDQHQVSELKLANGKCLSVKESLFARVPSDPLDQEKAFSWLKDNGGGELIKTQAILDSPSEATLMELSEKHVAYTPTTKVNTNSLQAFFREGTGLKKGSVALFGIEDIPQCFGVYQKREAKLA
jgi:hypothetical protein